jgi:diguanylate cyclase (GGDEF)-like protein/PAS domain S-box-containing protein
MSTRAAKLNPRREAWAVARLPLLWVLSVAALAAFGALVTIHAGNVRGWTAFEDLSETLAAVIACVACASRARTERRGDSVPGTAGQRAWRAWRLLAYGMGAWALGHIVWSVYEVGLGITPRPPSPLDAALLISSVLVVGGLLSMVSTPAGRLSHLRGAAEGMLIAAGCFLISWCGVIAAVFASSGASRSGQIIHLAYPVLDAVALSGVFFVAVRGKEKLPAGLGLLALGIICVAFSDSAFWYLNALNPSFPRVSPIDIGWVAGFLVITLAATQRQRPRRWTRRLAAGRLAAGLPTVPAVIGIATALVSWWAGRSLGPESVLLSISAALVLLALLLQLIVVYENQALTADLERRVEQRTSEVRATESYYRALVQNSSDVITVFDPDLTVRYVSDSMQDVFGHKPEELIGRRLDALTGGSSALTDALRRTMTEVDHVSCVQWDLTDATGRLRHAESAITNLINDPSVRALVLNTRDATDQVELQLQLRHQAFHDPLTGLANRALLTDRAEQALARSTRSGATVAVLLVDLDGFKFVNDSLGHQIGDVVLCEVARRLESLVRSEDTVARLGGDEFVILIDDVSGLEETEALGERICDVLRPRLELPGWNYAVTASVGVAMGSASEVDVNDLVRDADTAMYVVKTSGKDSVQHFAPSMHERARERFSLQADLQAALERSELLLFYQPIHETSDGRLKGFEALIRWSHPSRGLIAPERFIPLAEESGLIVPIGRWVLEHAIGQITAWDLRHQSARALSISVNVSTVQLTAPSLISDVETTLARSGIAPWRVILEITEGSLGTDIERTIEVLGELRKLGVRIAIDDFGTGYASLSHLQRLPVDILKVDKSFVTALGEGGKSRELLEAILGVGQALSLAVIAEGIESQSQMTTLEQLGCEMAQGFLVGKPSPAEVAESLLGADRPPIQGRLEPATRRR